MCSDIIFYSFGLYILGLVLLFASYDILLRITHRHGRIHIGLIFSFIFLMLMGTVFFILTIFVLTRLYTINKVVFAGTAIAFLAVGVGTFQIMKWKRQIIKDSFKNE